LAMLERGERLRYPTLGAKTEARQGWCTRLAASKKPACRSNGPKAVLHLPDLENAKAAGSD